MTTKERKTQQRKQREAKEKAQRERMARFRAIVNASVCTLSSMGA